MVAGLLLPLWATDKVAVRPPIAVGLNTTLTEQVALGASAELQPLLTTNSAGADEVTLLIVKEALPVLVNVTVAGVDVRPTVVAGITTPPGSARSWATVLAIPVPASPTVTGEPPAGVKVSVPARETAAVGVKLTVKEQLAPGDKVLLAQVLAVKAKSVPATTAEAKLCVVVLALVTVTVLFCVAP